VKTDLFHNRAAGCYAYMSTYLKSFRSKPSQACQRLKLEEFPDVCSQETGPHREAINYTTRTLLLNGRE